MNVEIQTLAKSIAYAHNVEYDEMMNAKGRRSEFVVTARARLVHRLTLERKLSVGQIVQQLGWHRSTIWRLLQR